MHPSMLSCWGGGGGGGRAKAGDLNSDHLFSSNARPTATVKKKTNSTETGFRFRISPQILELPVGYLVILLTDFLSDSHCYASVQ